MHKIINVFLSLFVLLGVSSLQAVELSIKIPPADAKITEFHAVTCCIAGGLKSDDGAKKVVGGTMKLWKGPAHRPMVGARPDAADRISVPDHASIYYVTATKDGKEYYAGPWKLEEIAARLRAAWWTDLQAGNPPDPVGYLP